MPKIDSRVIQAIKDYPIAEIISRYIELKRSGNNYKALCPFHGENTASFVVNTEKNFYYCFGCQATGDAIDFVREYRGATFTEAVEELSSFVGGIEYEQVSVKRKQIRKKILDQKSTNKELLETCRFLTDFFVNQKIKNNGEVLEYLQSRRIAQSTEDQERIGFAPNMWDYHKYFPKEISYQALEDLGILKRKRDEYSYYCTLRNRVMLPIINEAGVTLGFNGRALDNQPAKYMATKNTSICSKSQVWYGLNNILTGILFIVEGNFDVLSLKSLGYDAICPQGSSIKEELVNQINQREDISQIVVAFDNDAPGKKAMRTLLQYLHNPYASLYLLNYPKNIKDPSELISKNLIIEDYITLLEEREVSYRINEVEENQIRKSLTLTIKEIDEVLEKINRGATDKSLFNHLDVLKKKELDLKTQRDYLVA